MVAKRIVMLGMAILILSLAACGPQEPSTIVITLPPPAATATRPGPAATVVPSPIPPSPIPPTATLAEGSGGGGVDFFVMLVDYRPDPPQMIVVDPATGETQSTFDVPGLAPLSTMKIGGPFAFYLDPTTQIVNQIGFDGNVTEMRFITSDTDYFQGDFLPSPDGTLIAWGTSTFDPGGGNANRLTLKIANFFAEDEKMIVDQTLPDVSILPQPIQWSLDGRFLYYTNEPYGIGGYILFSGGPDLQRVDVATGQVTQILPDMGCLCAMAVSPDGKTVAYIAGSGPLEFVLHDIESGEERKTLIDPGHLQAGSVLWSPDGASLIYAMAISDFEHPEAEKYALVRVEAATLDQTILIPDDERLFNPMLWPTASALWLNDKDGNAWRLNPESGELVLAAEGKWVVK